MAIRALLRLDTKQAKKEATSFFRTIEGVARASQSVTRAQPFGGRLAPGLGGAFASSTGLLQAASPLLNRSIDAFFGTAQRLGGALTSVALPNFSKFTSALSAGSESLSAMLQPYAEAAALANPQATPSELAQQLDPIAAALKPLAVAKGEAGLASEIAVSGQDMATALKAATTELNLFQRAIGEAFDRQDAVRKHGR